VFAADDHDVLHFLTTSLHPPGQAPVPGGGHYVSDDEQRKIAQEYAEYQRKLEQQKEEYVTGYFVVMTLNGYFWCNTTEQCLTNIHSMEEFLNQIFGIQFHLQCNKKCRHSQF
jgi:hypothetical protein